jgi:hypothetical protein
VTEEIKTGNTGRTNKSVYRQNGNKKEREKQEKCEIFLTYDMRAYGSLEVELYSFLTSAMEISSFTPRPLYPRGKTQQYPMNRMLSEPK